MGKNAKANPRMLDMVMSDQNWLGRLSYVESVLYNRDVHKKRRRRSNTLFFILVTFALGVVSGLFLYYFLYKMF